MEPLLNALDIANRLGCSKSKIYRLRCYRPELLPPAIKCGAQVRWRKQDVEKWEAEQVAKSQGQAA